MGWGRCTTHFWLELRFVRCIGEVAGRLKDCRMQARDGIPSRLVCFSAPVSLAEVCGVSLSDFSFCNALLSAFPIPNECQNLLHLPLHHSFLGTATMRNPARQAENVILHAVS
jgi:hypothetical protein